MRDVCTQHQQQQGSVKFMVAQQMPLSAQADESSRLADASQTADAGSAGLPGADGKLSEHDGQTGGKAEIQRHGSDMHHLPEHTLVDAVDQHVSLGHASNEQILAWVRCSPSWPVTHAYTYEAYVMAELAEQHISMVHILFPVRSYHHLHCMPHL